MPTRPSLVVERIEDGEGGWPLLNGEPRDRARLGVHQGYGRTQKIRDLLLLAWPRVLTIVLLAKLAAILPRYTDRILSLLGKPRIVDDPCFDRPVALHLRQHQFPHLGKPPLVRPLALANKMQQRLMLGRRPFRRRNRRHRLNALALARHHQT